MRILHVTDHYAPVTGGIEIHVTTLAARQAAAGHDVMVLTSTPQRAEGRIEPDTGAVTVRRARSLLEGRRLDLSTFDLVHAHVSVVAPFSAPVAASFSRRGMPTVVTVHSLWNGLGPVPRWAAALAGLRSAPVLWSAVSGVAARQVAQRLPSERSVRVLPNASDLTPRAATRPDDGTVRLLSTMRLAPRKRPLELLSAFRHLVSRSAAPVTLTIVGDGPLRPRLEQLIRRHALQDRMRITGIVRPDRVRHELASADVYVAPAVLESFGLGALEARTVGLPVIGLLGTGLVEFTRHGVEGLLCRDDDGLVAGMSALVESPLLRRRISEHNRTVPSGLSWSRSLERHEQVYADALRGATSPAGLS